GDLRPGQALVLANHIQDASVDVYHLIIWDAEAFSSRQRPYVQAQFASRDWLNDGPEPFRKLADEAIAWSDASKTSVGEVSPQWHKKLPNGADVKLLGLSRPGDHPFK